MRWLERQERNEDEQEDWDLPLSQQDPGSPEKMSIWTILAAAAMWGLISVFVVGGLVAVLG